MESVLLPWLRILALAAACATGAFFVIGFDSISCVFLIFGAAVQKYAPRPGRWIIWQSACSASIWELALLVRTRAELATLLPVKLKETDPVKMALLGGIILLAALDLGLITDAIRRPRGSTNVRTRPIVEWLSWTVGLAANLWAFRNLFGYLHIHAPVEALVQACMAVAFDVALGVQFVRAVRRKP